MVFRLSGPTTASASDTGVSIPTGLWLRREPEAAAGSAALHTAAIYSTAHQLISLFSAISPTHKHARRESHNGWICPSAQSEEGRGRYSALSVTINEWRPNYCPSYLQETDLCSRLQPSVTGQQTRKNASKHHHVLNFFQLALCFVVVSLPLASIITQKNLNKWNIVKKWKVKICGAAFNNRVSEKFCF